MCCCKCNLNILEHLREVVIKLEITQDDALDFYGLEESEIASIINQHCQVKDLIRVLLPSLYKDFDLYNESIENQSIKVFMEIYFIMTIKR